MARQLRSYTKREAVRPGPRAQDTPATGMQEMRCLHAPLWFCGSTEAKARQIPCPLLTMVCWYSSGSAAGRWSTTSPGLLCAAVDSTCTAARRTCLDGAQQGGQGEEGVGHPGAAGGCRNGSHPRRQATPSSLVKRFCSLQCVLPHLSSSPMRARKSGRAAGSSWSTGCGASTSVWRTALTTVVRVSAAKAGRVGRRLLGHVQGSQCTPGGCAC